VYYRSDSARAAEVQAALAPLIEAVRSDLARAGAAGEPEVTIGFGLRYLGQNYEHTVELAEQEIDEAALRSIFTRHEALHDELYGYHLGALVVELVELTATARARSTVQLPELSSPDGALPTRRPVRFRGGEDEATVIRRGALAAGATLAGPAVVQEPDSTTLLGPQDRLVVLDAGTLSIDVGDGKG
jgi:N-methylhydantoinase A